MHPAGQELFGRYLQGIHQLHELEQFLVLFDPEKIAVFEPYELFGLSVAADGLQDLIGAEFIGDQFHVEQAFRHGQTRMEGHTAPDFEPHEPLRRLDFAHGHQSGQAAVQKCVEGLVISGRQENLVYVVLFCHHIREEIHERVFRIDVPVMFRLGDPVFPLFAVKGAVNLVSVVDGGFTEHDILIDVQVADKLRLHRNIFLYQLRPDLCDLGDLSQLWQGFAVKIGDGHPSDEEFECPVPGPGIHQRPEFPGCLRVCAQECPFFPVFFEQVIMVASVQHSGDIAVESESVKGITVLGQDRFQGQLQSGGPFL